MLTGTFEKPMKDSGTSASVSAGDANSNSPYNFSVITYNTGKKPEFEVKKDIEVKELTPTQWKKYYKKMGLE